jgi:hypothetical protein
VTATGEHCWVLDSEGLSRWVRGDRRMGVMIKAADKAGIRVLTTAMTLIEAYDSRIQKARWQWALSAVHVAAVTGEIAQEAITLMERAGLKGHKYAIDAALAAIALRQPGPVTIFTSDEDDMSKLCGNRLVIERL